MTSHVRARRGPSLPALLTAVLVLLLGLPTAALSAAPAHAAGEPVRVEDQTVNAVGEQGLSLYLKHSGGTDADVVRWSISGAPSWVDVQPNGYMTGLVPAPGGTFTFTITGTSGTYAGAPVSQSSGTFTIIAKPLPLTLGNSDAEDDGTTINVILGQKFKSRFSRTDGVVSSSAVPPGLTLAPDGTLSGVMTRPGTFPMPVTLAYHGVVVSETFNVVATSWLDITTGPWGRFPSVVIGRQFSLRVRAQSNVGDVRMGFAGKPSAGYKLKRLTSTVYTLSGKVHSRKKVRVPLTVRDESGTSRKITVVIKGFTAAEMGY